MTLNLHTNWGNSNLMNVPSKMEKTVLYNSPQGCFLNSKQPNFCIKIIYHKSRRRKSVFTQTKYCKTQFEALRRKSLIYKSHNIQISKYNFSKIIADSSTVQGVHAICDEDLIYYKICKIFIIITKKPIGYFIITSIF